MRATAACWDTTVSWDYPPSPAAHYDALLSRGASHSRFLRIARSSSDDPHRKTAIHLSPFLLRPSCMHPRPRSPNPMAHTLKRRKPQWPKPPHYHASLLRSPLSHRKGLFRAVLPPSKAVDFFRWDILLGTGHDRGWTRSCDVDAYASLHVAESVLEPYEAAAGFFGWHGLALDVIRRAQGHRNSGRCWGGLKHDRVGPQFEINEAAVEEGRARWARTAEELVGPPGLVLRLTVEHGKSDKVVPSSDPTQTHRPSRREDVRWDPGIRSGPSHPASTTSASDRKRQSPLSSSTSSLANSSTGSKPEHQSDSPSAWWHAPPPHCGLPNPHIPPLRFLPPPSVPYAPPPVQFSPWFPGSRVAAAQGNGYWYGAQPVGAPSSVTRDAKSLPPHSHVFATPATPTSSQLAHYPTKPGLGRDEYGPDHDCDKETETDHGYESTTTTTDSEPPPHTPVGAATTSHCVETFRLHGDDEVVVEGVEFDEEHAAASVTIRLSDPTAPVKLFDGFSAHPSGPSASKRDGCESSRGAVVFPSLNGSFCQGSSSQATAPLCSPGVSAQTTPARTATPVCPLSMSSSKESSNEEESKAKLERRDLEASASSTPGDGPALMLSLCSPPLTSPNAALRKDSQGFWEPVVSVSPSSSSSSLPLSPSEGRVGSRSTVAWISEQTGTVPRGCSDSPDSASTHSAKSRSLSPGPRRVTSAASTRSSSSRLTSFSSPTSTSTSTSASASVFNDSYPSSPSPPNGSMMIPSNPTTLLPAFLATATVKRKKASRTREIVDRLRSYSIDAGKGGVGLDGLGWLAGPSAGGEQDGKHGKVSSGLDHATGNHVAKGQPPSSPLPQSGADPASWVGTDFGKRLSSKPSESGSPGPGGKSNGMMQGVVSGPEAQFSHASSRTVTTMANQSITPFPILTVSPTSPANFAITRQSQTGGIVGCEPVVATPSKSVEGSKVNATASMSPDARSSGPQLVPSTPNGGTSPSARPCHHPLPSPSHPVHPQPVLGPPPPILAVAHYPHPVYVPFTQYHMAPPQQGQQGQGAWVAVYPGRPPHMPVHPLPAPPHVAPITGISGMRHVSW